MDFSSLLESGVSDKLRGILEAIREANGIFEDTQESRHGTKTNDWLRKKVLTRNLARPIFYLVNLWCIAEARGSDRAEETATVKFFFRSEGYVPTRFQTFFKEPPQSPGLNTYWADDKLVFKFADSDGEDAIYIALVRNLAALHDFVLASLDVWNLPWLEELRTNPSSKTVSAVTGEVTQLMSVFLNENLSGQQQFEKGRALHNFLNKSIAEDGASYRLDDGAPVPFWMYARDEGVKDFRLFNSVGKAFFQLAESYADGAEARAVYDPLLIAPNTKEGELGLDSFGEEEDYQSYVDEEPEEVEALFETLELHKSFVARLNEPGIRDINFLMGPAVNLVKSIDQPNQLALELPMTILRQESFGFQQSRISQAKRNGRDEKLPGLIACEGVGTYQDLVESYKTLEVTIEKVRCAIVHILVNMEHPSAASYVLAMLPTPLAEKAFETVSKNDWLDDPLIAIKTAALQIPELNAALKRCRDAYGSINRAGFQQLPAIELLDYYDEGFQLLGDIRDAVRAFYNVVTECAESMGGLEACFASDLSIFGAAFKSIEGIQQ